MAQKKVHGGMKFRVDPSDDNYANVAHQSDCVYGHNHKEEWCLEVWVVREAHQNKCGHRTLVYLCMYHELPVTKTKKGKNNEET